MATITTDFYRSSNGDRWQLVHDNAAGRYTVRHEPNLASGGRSTETSVDEFLAGSGSSPQHEALLIVLAQQGDGIG